jgi:5-hydroxyisourate hydrolase-like protein (transthyretin family)
VRPPDNRLTNPAEQDQFLRELTSGSLADTSPPAPRPGPQRPRPPRDGTDPHGPHPIGAREPSPQQRRSQASPEEPPPRGRRRRGRLAAWSSLAIVALAVVVLVLDSDDQRSPADDGNGGAPNGSRGAANGTPASDNAQLRVAWDANRAERLRARWRPGGTTIVAGRLTSPGGRPVAGARVTVLAADAERPEQGDRTVGELRTDRDGRLRAAIALDQGAARKLLTFTYLAHAHDTVPAAVDRARLEVSAPSRLHTPTGSAEPGDRVELHGTGAPNATVRLLADPPGRGDWQTLAEPPGAGGWQTLATVRAGRNGRWDAEVRFPNDAISGRYRLRARVAANPRRGYLTATSPAVEVEVR